MKNQNIDAGGSALYNKASRSPFSSACGSLIFLVTLVFRHGWRCFNALGGVFAKQKLLCTIAAGMLLLCTCSNPASVGKEGVITINIGSGARGVAWPSTGAPSDTFLNILTHRITLEKVDETGAVIDEIPPVDMEPGTRTKNISVSEGLWKASVVAYYETNDFVFATGISEEPVLVAAGPPTPCPIVMEKNQDNEFITVSNGTEWGDLGSYISPGKNNIVFVMNNITATGTATISGGPVTIFGGFTVTKSGNGNLLNVTAGGNVTLDGPTLQGHGSNTNALVYVNGGGNLELISGTIKDNTANGTDASGGGVYVAASGSTFNMYGGTITNNKAVGTAALGGGGVFVNGGTFTMTGGTISGNTVEGGTLGGGGVHITSSGTFNMDGGTIGGGNTAPNGGGVFVTSTSNFYMSDGTISGNTANGLGGGGVYVIIAGFTMSGGTIGSGNRASSADGGAGHGGGVFVGEDGTFIMESDAYVSGNIADNLGGGVFVTGDYATGEGTFIMDGGTINGNNALSDGGGVYQQYPGALVINGTTVTGNTPNDVRP